MKILQQVPGRMPGHQKSVYCAEKETILIHLIYQQNCILPLDIVAFFLT